MKRIAPCLWFDRNALEAAKFYVKVFKNSRLGRIAYYGKEGFEIHGMLAGTVLTVDFTLDGQPFTALNGGPQFKFSEAVSFAIQCKDQGEVEHYWRRLTQGGGRPQPCGWLKDKFGVSWQVVPTILPQLMGGKDPARSERVMAAVLKMGKIDIAALKKAARG